MIGLKFIPSLSFSKLLLADSLSYKCPLNQPSYADACELLWSRSEPPPCDLHPPILLFVVPQISKYPRRSCHLLTSPCPHINPRLEGPECLWSNKSPILFVSSSVNFHLRSHQAAVRSEERRVGKECR